MSLLGDYSERLASHAPNLVASVTLPIIAIDLPRAAETTRLITTPSELEMFVAELNCVDLSAVALDSEYGFRRPHVSLRNGRDWYDIRSQRPICISLAAWAKRDGASFILKAVIDVRTENMAPAIAELLRLHIPFIFHNIKAELCTFWSLGMDPHIQQVYDTKVVAACLNLGRYHARGEGDAATGKAEKIRGEDALKDRKGSLLSLTGQCHHYGLDYPFSGDKDEIRGGFLNHDYGLPLSQKQVDYAAADAEYTLRLYLAQQVDVVAQGLQHALYAIEFPFAIANARMEWRGVPLDLEAARALKKAAGAAAAPHEQALVGMGVTPAGSRTKFEALMTREGLLAHFVRKGDFSTEDDVLRVCQRLHPAVEHLRQYRKLSRLSHDEWLDGLLTGDDGRLHAHHLQLGSATGRNTCATPNLCSLSRDFRPLVVAPPGRALFEVDYSQVEIGVAAAEHNDPALIAAYNSDDVYASMAQRFYGTPLQEEDRRLTPPEFKTRHPELRANMKTFVLAVIYNIQPPGIASRFGITESEAAEKKRRFLGLFPALRQGLESSRDQGRVRGYASTVSGIRRPIWSKHAPSQWTGNFLMNTPIQGSAASVFKQAAVRLDEAFRGTSTWLILPVHDSILFECDEDELEESTHIAAEVMRCTLHAIYPVLDAKVDVNRSAPHCWNKDGDAESLRRFLDMHVPGKEQDIHLPDAGASVQGELFEMVNTETCAS